MRYFSLLPLTLLIISCNSQFLSTEAINALPYFNTNEHQIIYYNQTIEILEDGEVNKKVHTIFKVGNNLKSLSPLLYVQDNSIEHLIDYQAQITSADDKNKYSTSDLITYNISNANIITEDEVKILPVTDLLSPGDLIETVSVHKHGMPELGFHFSPYMDNAVAFNIQYVFIMPPKDSLCYKVYNGTIEPVIQKSDEKKIYTFKWQQFSPIRNRHFLQYKNKNTHILSRINTNDWGQFGNWYLDLIKHRLKITPQIQTMAVEITAGKNSELQKMNAIFDHVQKNYRYEQVYLDKGGFIPNEPSTIIKNKYGDCKDYSILIYLMAKSLGIPAKLSLCYRGRGLEFHNDMAVSQFNHVIVNFNHNGQNYWYDGTNRTGINGVPSKDLINQQALVIDSDNTHLVTIKESEKNNLIINGTLSAHNDDLTGELEIVLKQQYAMDFFYIEYFYNDAKFRKYIASWIKNNIGSNVGINSVGWSQQDNQFIITINGILPNSLVNIGEYSYFSLSNLFNQIIPKINVPNTSPSLINYFPDYNNIEINLSFSDLMAYDETTLQNSPYKLRFSQKISPGPFSDEEKKEFINNFSNSCNQYEEKIKLTKKRT